MLSKRYPVRQTGEVNDHELPSGIGADVGVGLPTSPIGIEALQHLGISPYGWKSRHVTNLERRFRIRDIESGDTVSQPDNRVLAPGVEIYESPDVHRPRRLG